MKLNNYPLSRKDNIVVQEAGDEVLLYDLNDNKAFCLNETSAVVWELCDGKSSVAEINQKLSKKLNIKTDDNLVWLALDQLKKEKLLSNAEEVKIDFNGLSRRDAIRKVGFASLVALPVIMAITSPVAAVTQSVCGADSGITCACADISCSVVEVLAMAAAPNQASCSDSCNPTNGSCRCNGPFICGGGNQKFGMCT
ncbi:MAG TPA: PqqD family protein [Pyrinomonadaceae bacterium]|nr:PqqD family protein [Pyrinomonadaceae bacterium]